MVENSNLYKAICSNNKLEWMRNLYLKTTPHVFCHTTVIATVGPKTNSAEMIESFIEEGVTIFRLNLSHGSREYHAANIRAIRQASENYNRRIGRNHPIAIGVDTKGPLIRTGKILTSDEEIEEIELKKGDVVHVTGDPSYEDKCTSDLIYINYERVSSIIRANDRIVIKDGFIELRCLSFFSHLIKCVVEVGGKFGNNQIVHLPGVQLDLPFVTEEDREDLDFFLKLDVDVVFASYMRGMESVAALRAVLYDNGSQCAIVSKVEDLIALENIDEIVRCSDGVLVERGNLGIELGTEALLLAQKKVIAKCNVLGKPVICAYDLMTRMTKKTKPSRAEITDVTNAILDGCDCLMLCGETAKGEYPLEAVRTTLNTCREIECLMWYKQIFYDLIDKEPSPIEVTHATAMAAVEASTKLLASVIITCTGTGRTARLLSRYRPRCPIVAVTRNEKVARQSYLHRSVIPLVYEERAPDDWVLDLDSRVAFGVSFAEKRGLIKLKDPMVIVTGWKEGAAFTNTIRIIFFQDFRQTYVY